MLGLAWWVFRLKHAEQHDLERTADEDADEALESISGGDAPKKKKKKGKGKGAEGKGGRYEDGEEKDED